MVINFGILTVVNVSIEKAAHLLAEECEEIIDNKTVPIKKHNKAVPVKNCNSFDACIPIYSIFISGCNNYW